MLFFLFLLLAMLLTSCNGDSECREERFVAMGVKLMQPKFDAEKETYVSVEFVPDSLLVKGVGNDSILYSKSQTKELLLPLQKSENKSQFVFCANGKYDTVTILHENKDNFLSMECGCIVFATIKEVVLTKNRLDSAKIIIPEVVNVKANHVEIFYQAEK